MHLAVYSFIISGRRPYRGCPLLRYGYDQHHRHINFHSRVHAYLHSSVCVSSLGGVPYSPPLGRSGALMLVCGWRLGSMYMKAQLSVKREQSNAKAPVIGVFSGAIAGLSETSISVSVAKLIAA
jgi:hypothetical protein